MLASFLFILFLLLGKHFLPCNPQIMPDACDRL